MGDFRVELTAQSERTIAKLRGTDIMPDLRKELRNATDEMQPAVRQAARSLPSERKGRGGNKSTSLRRAIAASVKRRVKVNGREVRVDVYTQPSGGKSNLARCVEGVIPWEHPTYGHKPTVRQNPKPFFYDTIQAMIPKVTARVSLVLSDYEKKL
jgi:hypothetical protein